MYPEQEYFAHLAPIFDKVPLAGVGVATASTLSRWPRVVPCVCGADGYARLRSRLPLVGKQGANSGKSTIFGG